MKSKEKEKNIYCNLHVKLSNWIHEEWGCCNEKFERLENVRRLTNIWERFKEKERVKDYRQFCMSIVFFLFGLVWIGPDSNQNNWNFVLNSFRASMDRNEIYGDGYIICCCCGCLNKTVNFWFVCLFMFQVPRLFSIDAVAGLSTFLYKNVKRGYLSAIVTLIEYACLSI